MISATRKKTRNENICQKKKSGKVPVFRATRRVEDWLGISIKTNQTNERKRKGKCVMGGRGEGKQRHRIGLAFDRSV
jgi:hypothetical protein